MSAAKPFFSIRRLRWTMLVGCVTVVLVVAGYIGYARYKLHRLVADLPGRLGINITQETDHVTYSQTWQGRTVFTLRAAKQIQHKDGTITLQDVGVVLYGRKGDRQDRIHGSEFQYDQKQGIMRAVGEVYIDLAPPPSKNPGQRQDDESRLIHVKTSGLVFEQKEQIASTENALEFMVSGMTGTAVGARYDSNEGVLVLQSQVRVSGLKGKSGSAAERPMVLTAGHAELDRNGNVAILEAAKLVSATENGTQQGSAQHTVVHMTAEGTPQRVDANGAVTLTGEGRGTVTSDRLELELSSSGQPRAAHLFGSVRYINDVPAKQQRGSASDARIAFDPEGRPVHAVLTGAVEGNVVEGVNTRLVSGDKVELALAGGGKQPVLVRGATATAKDGARVRLVNASARKDPKGKVVNGIETTNVKADVLTARFAAGAKTQLAGVDGMGRTAVERTLSDLAGGPQQWKESGTGDALKVDFRADAKNRLGLARAEQRGSVRIIREAASTKKNGAPDIEHAEADLAVYDADAERMTMTGGAKVSDAESALFADRIEINRATGDAVAEGLVRVSYLQPGSKNDPMHVIAARAVGHKSSGITDFFATPGGNARMWQGGSSVEAPMLEFDRTKKTVAARGTAAGSGQIVKTVLVEEPKPGAKPARQGNGPVRVMSREMLYSDATRQVEFRGGVQVNSQDGMLQSQVATVYLAPKVVNPTSAGSAGRDAAPGELGLGGRVDRMVSSGDVKLDQPGRRGSGEKLVYTSDDRTFVLTGTKAAPPKIVDEAQGNVTGAELRFRSGDDSVEVLGGDGAQKVHTETRMKQKD